MKIATRRFVRPEFMNHHQTLYAGYISEWLTEAAMIGVTEVMGETEHVVLAAVREIRIKSKEGNQKIDGDGTGTPDPQKKTD